MFDVGLGAAEALAAKASSSNAASMTAHTADLR
jgi:hypothetical protein